MKTTIGKGKWKITVLYCGEHTVPKSAHTVGLDSNLILRFPYLAFLLQNGESNVLVDNGINERFLIDGKAWGGAPADAGSKDLVASLQKAGLTVDDIDLILYTHLHNDHAGNCNLFPQTRSIAQQDEWFNLLNQVFVETQRRDYDNEVIPFLKANKNFHTIDGDLEIMEGLRVVKTPGHTRGSQTVVVNTVNGLRLLVGDQFHQACSCFPEMISIMDVTGKEYPITPAPEGWPTIPSSLIYDYYDYYASTDRIRALMPERDPMYVLCGHDASLLYRKDV